MDGMALTELAYGALDDWFQVVFETGAYAAMLAMVVLVINILFRRWLSAGQMGLLWGLVLIRLLVPVSPPSPLGLANLLTYAPTENAEAPLPTMEAVDDQVVAADSAMGNVRKLTDLNLPTEAVAVTTATDDWLDTIFSAIPLVWFIGGALGLVWTLASYSRFCRRVRQTPDCTDERLQRLWQTSCETAGVKRTGRLLRFDGVEQPAIMGVLWPTLLLPSDNSELADDQLRMVMLHELAHVRRWDIAANWLLVVIRAIYWWNPIYWLAAARFRSLREQACDAFVVRQLKAPSTHNYGELLLALAKRRPATASWRIVLPASMVSFFPLLFRNRAIRTRLQALQHAGITRGRWHSAAVCGVLLLLAISGFTTASQPEDTPADLPTWMASHPEVVLQQKRSYVVQDNYEGPRESRNYDIAKCLDRIAVDSGTRANAQRDFKNTLNGIYNHPTAVISNNAATADENGTPAEDKEKLAPLSFQISGTTLTATAPAALHAKLQRTLDAWTESGLASQITVTIRFLAADHDMVSKMGISWQILEAFSADSNSTLPPRSRDGQPIVRATTTVDEFLPTVIASLDPHQTSRLLALANRSSRANTLNAPKITFFNGQEAEVADCSQRPFVIGVVQKSAGANEAKVAVLEEGTRINLRGTVSHDSSKLHLEARLKMSSVGEVATATTMFGGGPVSIQIPRLNRNNIDVVTDIEDGHTLLIGCLPADNGNRRRNLYCLITVCKIQPDSTGPESPQRE